MRGHQEIVDRRMNEKRKPVAIFIHDCELVDSAFEGNHGMPSVSLSKDDVIQSLDLRFAKGCQVHAIFLDEIRARAMFDRLIQFKPSMCSVCVVHARAYDPKGELWMGIYTEEQGIKNG